PPGSGRSPPLQDAHHTRSGSGSAGWPSASSTAGQRSPSFAFRLTPSPKSQRRGVSRESPNRALDPALPTRYHRAPGSLPWFCHFVADSVKFFLDFGHIPVLIRNLAGADQRSVALFQSCCHGLTHETRTLARGNPAQKLHS